MIDIKLPISAALLAASAAAQLPCWNSDTGVSLGIQDETVSAALPLGFTFAFGGVGYTDIQVCDNGYITLGATGGIVDWAPTSQTLVGDPCPRICPLWMDLNPGATGGGDVRFQAVPASGADPAHAVITWLDCLEFGGTFPHTFQLVLIDGGAVRCSYGPDLGLSGTPWLVGASPGNGAAPLPVDLATLPVLTNGSATFHDELLGGAPPLIGVTVDWQPDGTGGYTISAVQGCATSSTFGSGCVGRFTSFYEMFSSAPAVDLSNSAFELLFTGTGYTVSPTSAAFTPPGAGAASLNLIDDSETTVTLSSALSYPGGSTTSLSVCSNGHVSVASNSALADYTPTPAEFLAWPHATWAVWHDFIPGPTGGGDVLFEENGALSILTWLDVLGYEGYAAGTTPSSFQLVLDRSTGNVRFAFGQLDTVGVSGYGSRWVVGFSPGGPSLDPGSADLSSALAGGSIFLDDFDQAPLAVAALGPPTAGSTIALEVAGITPNAQFGGILGGLAKFDPGISLAAIGMPDCFQYNNQLFVQLFFPAGAGSYQVPFAVPNLPGLPIQVQAALYDGVAGRTPLGATASNGLELDIGH